MYHFRSDAGLQTSEHLFANGEIMRLTQVAIVYLDIQRVLSGLSPYFHSTIQASPKN
jgi:hypothetical protein